MKRTARHYAIVNVVLAAVAIYLFHDAVVVAWPMFAEAICDIIATTVRY